MAFLGLTNSDIRIAEQHAQTSEPVGAYWVSEVCSTPFGNRQRHGYSDGELPRTLSCQVVERTPHLGQSPQVTTSDMVSASIGNSADNSSHAHAASLQHRTPVSAVDPGESSPIAPTRGLSQRDRLNRSRTDHRCRGDAGRMPCTVQGTPDIAAEGQVGRNQTEKRSDERAMVRQKPAPMTAQRPPG